MRGGFRGVLFALLLAGCAPGEVRVIDGDTIAVGQERIRLLGIDAPELFSPRCEVERVLARIAKGELERFLGSGPLSLRRGGKDRFGRTLAHVIVNGRDAGEYLVTRGVARPWRGRRESWCPSSSGQPQ